jgi:hypothetical protein
MSLEVTPRRSASVRKVSTRDGGARKAIVGSCPIRRWRGFPVFVNPLLVVRTSENSPFAVCINRLQVFDAPRKVRASTEYIKINL